MQFTEFFFQGRERRIENFTEYNIFSTLKIWQSLHVCACMEDRCLPRALRIWCTSALSMVVTVTILKESCNCHLSHECKYLLVLSCRSIFWNLNFQDEVFIGSGLFYFNFLVYWRSLLKRKVFKETAIANEIFLTRKNKKSQVWTHIHPCKTNRASASKVCVLFKVL